MRTIPNYPEFPKQSISNTRFEGDTLVLSISIGEMRANWLCAASLADREGMHGVAERLRNDVKVIERLKADDIVRFTA
jgi:hypothetical protein